MKVDLKAVERWRAAGFTLLEILVAMVILSFIVALMGNMFKQVSDAWNVGVENAEVNNAGRAALDLIAYDLSQAVAGPLESAAFNGENRFYMANGDELSFVAFKISPLSGGAAISQRALHGVKYYKDGDTLNRVIRADTADIYVALPAHQAHPWGNAGANELLDNVLDFRLRIWDGVATDTTWDEPRLPDAIDVYLELMPADAMITYDAMPPARQLEFRAERAKRFSTRVYLRNRRGYQPP